MSRADQRKFHYIYKITRLDESGKYYIGMHSTDNVDDGYFGSGSYLSKSIKKHGKEKHGKEILEFLDSREALKLRERELVDEELLLDKRCMNLQLGGEGGFTSAQMKNLWGNPEYRERVSGLISKSSTEQWQKPEFREKISKIMRAIAIKAWKDPDYRKNVVMLQAKNS